MDTGLIGGIVGGVIGICGGVIGTYFGISRTNGPRERALMCRWAVTIWIGVIVFLCVLFLLPQNYRWVPWIPYGLALGFSIRTCNREQQRIRDEESAAQ